MILHPIACAVAFIAFALSCGAGVVGSLLGALVALLAWVLTLVVMAIDFSLFGVSRLFPFPCGAALLEVGSDMLHRLSKITSTTTISHTLTTPQACGQFWSLWFCCFSACSLCCSRALVRARPRSRVVMDIKRAMILACIIMVLTIRLRLRGGLGRSALDLSRVSFLYVARRVGACVRFSCELRAYCG